MIDVKRLRAHPEGMREAIRRRHVDPERADLDGWLALDVQKRALETELAGLNAERNSLAQLGRAAPGTARERGQALRRRARDAEERLRAVTADWRAILDWLPNWPEPGMPDGSGEEENREERVWTPGPGYLPEEQLGCGSSAARFMPGMPVHAEEEGFTPLHHLDLAERLGGIDVEQAAKVSGSRFAYLLGDVALLQFGLQWLLAEKLLAEGFQPIVPPLLVRERSLYGTSHFPEGRDQVYAIDSHNVEEHRQLFLVGSSEPANFSYFADRVLAEPDLPIKLFAATTCFRSEVGSWGKDVRGIKRVHQFDKIELNAVCTPEQSRDLYDHFLALNEWLLQTLELPYRVVDKCGGDAGYLATARQRDVEVWLASGHEFMEVMTDTNTTDYQARRLNIRYRTAGGELRFCHTVNDTGCAIGRMLIAILDQYQQKDGSVKVPDALRPMVKREYVRPGPLTTSHTIQRSPPMPIR
ncbi:MAG: serine--tRNA ligase [Chloroflexi bacterium]|nr:serine--tRNA ligase [Chloroflexota bacterium]